MNRNTENWTKLAKTGWSRVDSEADSISGETTSSQARPELRVTTEEDP